LLDRPPTDGRKKEEVLGTKSRPAQTQNFTKERNSSHHLSIHVQKSPHRYVQKPRNLKKTIPGLIPPTYHFKWPRKKNAVQECINERGEGKQLAV